MKEAPSPYPSAWTFLIPLGAVIALVLAAFGVTCAYFHP
jgi:hypothetical protein